jgi:hypothetical protein
LLFMVIGASVLLLAAFITILAIVVRKRHEYDLYSA